MKKEKEFHQWGGDTKQMLKLICSRDKTLPTAPILLSLKA